MKKHPKELVDATAHAIKDHFIPKDSTAKTFSFHFTIPPSSNYKARFDRNEKGDWYLVGTEIDQPEY